MCTEEVPIYTNQSITQRKYDSAYRRDTYIYQSINYTEGVRQCIQNRYLYIPISQLYRGGMTMYTKEVYIYIYIYQSVNYIEEERQCIQKTYLYIPINQLHRGVKIMYAEEVPIYTNISITQRR